LFNLPISEYETKPSDSIKYPTWSPKIIVEYGEPFVSHNGNLYCWKRTPNKYSILKWVWVESPDSPHSLNVIDTKSSLSITWEAPNQDADKVTEYEVGRSVDICGEFKAINQTKKSILRYIDEDVNVGETYYYKVRAIKSSGYSGYSNKAVGKL